MLLTLTGRMASSVSSNCTWEDDYSGVCLRHFNELPFRHIFQHIDGATTGPKYFSGSTGQQLTGCEKLPVVEYDSVNCLIPEVDRKMLSKDQHQDIAQRICQFETLVLLSYSKWLTAANKVLRLYISVSNPSENLKQIVTFILKSYMPVWLNIKMNKYFTDMPKYVFLAIQRSLYLSEDLLQVVDPVIERNAFFAHLENLLLAMILRIYIDIIDWSSRLFYPPPMLWDVCDDEIKITQIPKLRPSETSQSFPVAYRQWRDVCQTICGHEARDGYIRSTLLSRSVMPDFSQKSDFKPLHIDKKQQK
ncbi:hypothetical protein PR048_008054 [Dryococelus australis]|uniref:Uncharacterized protein n=1 Tax=Dryococelus australis TaxID=614101 RepID=A0ABQ9HXN3_9NEOP|nr:hypothetical protein PR048_008054 [Dryococelus australis]